jgi:hypothetical protein
MYALALKVKLDDVLFVKKNVECDVDGKEEGTAAIV